MKWSPLVAATLLLTNCAKGPPAVCDDLLSCCQGLPEALVASCRDGYERALELESDELEAACRAALDVFEASGQCMAPNPNNPDDPPVMVLPDLPPSQGLSQPCDPKYGTDACGAALFCAAFDGRSIPTCYPERSRQVGETCGEARHCLTNGCSNGGRCQASSGQDCDPTVGCAEPNQVCAPSRYDPRIYCQDVGLGELGDLCAESAHCQQGFVCTNFECSQFGGVGGACETSFSCDLGLACLQGFCGEPMGGPGASCEPANDACPAGTHCEVLTLFPEPRFECTSDGPAGAFEPCDEITHCSAGLLCLRTSREGSMCVRPCRVDTRECPDGLECIDPGMIGLPDSSFSLCV